MENIHKGVLNDQRESIKDQRFQLTVDFFPVLVHKLISAVAQRFVTLVQVLKVYVQSESNLAF